MSTKKLLKDSSSNTYSQFGEDGIIAKIFSIIGTKSRLAIEFGAWDGVYHSNTARLWKELDWSAILIESNPTRYLELVRSASKKCLCINAKVEHSGPQSLENIIARSNIKDTPDLLSIDIDGDEYHILKSLYTLKPRVVICEFNPTIPPEMMIVQHPGNILGSSAKALFSLMVTKGYSLVAATDTNCIFVLNEYSELFGEYEINSLDIVPRHHLTYLINDYKGDYLTSRYPTYGFNKPSKQRTAIGDLTYLESGSKTTRTFARLKNFLKRSIFIKHKADTKYETIEKYRKQYVPEIFIETGTYLGGMIMKVLHNYKKIYSVELDWTLYNRAREIFSENSKVEIIQGDSAEVLPRLINDIDEPVLFWLDGHYSGGITAKGLKFSPAQEELEAILKHRIKRHCILIDDARHFTGENDYPSLEEIATLIKENGGYYNISVDHDIIVLLPL